MLYKRNDSKFWWIKITHDGKIIQRSTGTNDKKLAQEYHDKLKVDLWNQSKLGDKPKYIWQEAVLKWLEESAHKKSIRDNKIHLRWLDYHLADKTLQSITKREIEALIKIRAAEGVKNATVNRMLAVLRSILRKAELEWEWIDKAPKIKLLPEPKKRVRWLTKEETEKLIDNLPDHLKLIVGFAIETGLRHSNVLGLKWQQVDLDRNCAWIYGDESKSGQSIPVPLSEKAISIIRSQQGINETFVFTYQGKQVKQANTRAFRNTLKRAGIENFRFHDLRHTWASHHIQNGTPLFVLQELGGWKSPEMVKKYAHLSSEHLRKYVEKD